MTTMPNRSPSDLAVVLSGLREEISALRGDLLSERQERREALAAAERHGMHTRWAAATVVTIGLAVGAGWTADSIATANQRAAQACQTRIESREEIRASMVAISAYAAEYAGLDASATDDLIAGAEQIAVETLPPPDC